MTLADLENQVSAAGGKKRIDRYTLAEACLDRNTLDGFSVKHVADKDIDPHLGRLINIQLQKVGLACYWRANVWQNVVAVV